MFNLQLLPVIVKYLARNDPFQKYMFTYEVLSNISVLLHNFLQQQLHLQEWIEYFQLSVWCDPNYEINCEMKKQLNLCFCINS
ncbi:hypothetical protein PR048_024899 [Dryococelus australis]|uniref:Uncharacterized protein n=1 Tax=Dryococelus australis TaxID=614101 RepID=A0ABQ9GPX3_9NEOP|nr:hypothetical protein PR048_024899 [Dryococelus australis]